MKRGRHFQRAWVTATAMVSLAASAATAQTQSIPAAELVRRTVQNEIKASQMPGTPRMFVSVKQGAHGSQTKLYCETKDAMAGMAIAYDGKPLNATQRQAEEARLDQLIKEAEELKKKRQHEKEDTDRVERIVRAMPDAFLYEYDG